MSCHIQMLADYQITENYHSTEWIGRWVVMVMAPQVLIWYSKMTFFCFQKTAQTITVQITANYHFTTNYRVLEWTGLKN